MSDETRQAFEKIYYDAMREWGSATDGDSMEHGVAIRVYEAAKAELREDYHIVCRQCDGWDGLHASNCYAIRRAAQEG